MQVTGNAMSVPVVGAALTAMLRSVASVTDLGTALPLSIKQDSREARARGRELKRRIANDIALLDGLRLKYQKSNSRIS